MKERESRFIEQPNHPHLPPCVWSSPSWPSSRGTSCRPKFDCIIRLYLAINHGIYGLTMASCRFHLHTFQSAVIIIVALNRERMFPATTLHSLLAPRAWPRATIQQPGRMQKRLLIKTGLWLGTFYVDPNINEDKFLEPFEHGRHVIKFYGNCFHFAALLIQFISNWHTVLQGMVVDAVFPGAAVALHNKILILLFYEPNIRLT